MNTGLRVREASSPQDALAALADALDALHTDVLALQIDKDSKPDPWDKWDAVVAPTEDVPEGALARIEVTRKQLESATGEERQALEAKLRLALDKGGSIEAPAEGNRSQQEVSEEGDVVVDLPPASPEQQELRRRFATENLELGTNFYPELVEAYVKGGPLLLYYTDREFVMGLPQEWRQAMVQDVLEHSPTEAQEFGRDVLKNTSPGGPEITTEAVLREIA